MKNRILLGLFSGLFFALPLVATDPSFAKVTMEVLNPRGEIDPPQTAGLSPRLTDLAGKTIGLYDNGKEGFTAFLDVTEELLKQRFPTTTIKRYNGAFDLGDRLSSKIAKEVDAVIYGSGD